MLCYFEKAFAAVKFFFWKHSCKSRMEFGSSFSYISTGMLVPLMTYAKWSGLWDDPLQYFWHQNQIHIENRACSQHIIWVTSGCAACTGAETPWALPAAGRLQTSHTSPPSSTARNPLSMWSLLSYLLTLIIIIMRMFVRMIIIAVSHWDCRWQVTGSFVSLHRWAKRGADLSVLHPSLNSCYWLLTKFMCPVSPERATISSEGHGSSPIVFIFNWGTK